LIMPRISRLNPLCVAILPLKKSMPFPARGHWALGLDIIIIIPFSPLRSEPPLTWHLIGSFSQATSEDRHIWDAIGHVLIQFRDTYWIYWKNCPHLLFASQQDK
jgi:hypothetical protein